MQTTCFLTVIALWTFTLSSTPPKGFAESQEPEHWKRGASQGLCGVYSMFAVSKALGHQTRLVDWVKPEYFSQPWGSSSEDLVRAARDNGLDARAMAGLTPDDVSRLGVPAILHVRPRGGLDMFLHWVAFLGTTADGRLNILDPETGQESIDIAELAARFDGHVVLVAQPRDSWPYLLAKMRLGWIMRAFVGGLCLMGAILAVNSVGRSREGRAVILVAMMLFPLAGARHLLFADGLLADPTGLASRLAEYSTEEFEEVSLEHIRRLAAGDVPGVLIDARMAQDFRAGSIPRSVNMPLQISLDRQRQIVAELEMASEVVVFCQSERCMWSVFQARRLAASGVRNIHIFPGGYVEWKRIAESAR